MDSTSTSVGPPTPVSLDQPADLGPRRPDPGHNHGPARRVTSRMRLVLTLALLPGIALTAAGLYALWPTGDDRFQQVSITASDSSIVEADVLRVMPEAGLIEVDVDGPTLAYVPATGFAGGIEVGDRVKLVGVEGVQGLEDGAAPYFFFDHVREIPIGMLAMGYLVLVLVVARWKGLASLAGLVITFGLIAAFTLPALLSGYNPLAVGVVTAAAAMFVVLYLAHGFSARTTTALLGTLLGLALTACLASWATGAASLTGISGDGEEAMLLRSYAPAVDLRGVVLCGIILAGLGVLNDVTITQASAVWELKTIAPSLGRRELFSRGMRIGRDHIASTVYTIAFAYVGAALPLMLLVAVFDRSFIEIVTAQEIAEEVVRTLVGSIGLVAAIPLTTAIAALVVCAGLSHGPTHGVAAEVHVEPAAPGS